MSGRGGANDPRSASRDRLPAFRRASDGALEQVLASGGDGIWEWWRPDADSSVRICVSGGRIAWAHNTEVGVFLSQRLATALDITLELLRDHLVACRASGRPLGEYLVDRGVMTALELRTVLAAHNREHLAAFISRPLPDEHSFEPHDERYDARFTFSVAELSERGRTDTTRGRRDPRDRRSVGLHASPATPDDLLDRVMQLSGAQGAALVDLEIECCLDGRGLTADTIESLALGQASVSAAATDLAGALESRAQFDEVVITLPTTLHILRPIPGTSQVLFLVVDRQESTAALALHQLAALEWSS